MILISLLIFVGLVSSDSSNGQVSLPNSFCSCGQIVTQFDCTLANKCSWDYISSSCSGVNCTAITDHYSCALTSSCLWNSTACLQPNKTGIEHLCNEITTSTTLTCEQGNVFCTPNTNGTGCVHKSAIVNSTCTTFTTPQQCLKNSLACKWEAATAASGTCQPITCANLRTQEDCLYYATSTTYQQLQLCTWVNDNCVAASQSQVSKYSYNDCFLNTLGTYRYSSNTIDKSGQFTGTCEPCYQILLSGLIIALLIA